MPKRRDLLCPEHMHLYFAMDWIGLYQTDIIEEFQPTILNRAHKSTNQNIITRIILYGMVIMKVDYYAAAV
jgi:hypothetical protein